MKEAQKHFVKYHVTLTTPKRVTLDFTVQSPMGLTEWTRGNGQIIHSVIFVKIAS